MAKCMKITGTGRARIGVILVLLTAVGICVPGTAQADDIRSSQWYLKDFDIEKVHELSRGAGVTIGIIDTGVTPDHPDIEGNIVASSDEVSVRGDGLEDDIGHGTAISSVIAGHGHGESGSQGILGIAPESTIISVDVINESGNPPITNPLPTAIRWLVDNGADVISLSMHNTQVYSEQTAINYAVNSGVPVVVSAGNHDPDKSQDHASNDTEWPARAHNAIPVSGTTHGGDFWTSGSLNLHNADPFPAQGLSAPAHDIPIATPSGGYDVKSGTSFASPIVAATLGLIRSSFPELTYDQVIARLLRTTEDKGPKGFDDEYGWGLVNPYRALTEDVVVDQSDAYPADRNSSADQRVPLNEQGEDIGAPPTEEPEQQDQDNPGIAAPTLTGVSSGLPLWEIWFLSVAATLVISISTAVIVMVRRHKKTVSAVQNPSR